MQAENRKERKMGSRGFPTNLEEQPIAAALSETPLMAILKELPVQVALQENGPAMPL